MNRGEVVKLTAAENVMSKEKQKIGYCGNCDMNVPHWRVKAKGLQEIVCDVLQKLQMGRWHCLKCQKTRYVLRFINDDAVDYRIDEPSDPVDPFDPTAWLRSVNKLDSDCDMSPLFENQGQQPTQSTVQKTLFAESSSYTLREDPLVVGEAGHRGTVESGRSVESQQRARGKDPEVAIAEPVGNFIKEQSLAVNATRMKRFTEKYRDALVERILSGKAQMSWLIADGKCTEAELVSWIDDKAKRESADENETIELDLVARKRD